MELKQRQGTRISVVIPARNEERTVADVVAALSRELVTRSPLVDERPPAATVRSPGPGGAS